MLLLFDQAISGRESAAHAKLTELLARKVPADAPTGFVPVVFHPFGRVPHPADLAGGVIAYRHYWELGVLTALRTNSLSHAGGADMLRLRT